MLREFVTVHREEIIARCRAKTARRGLTPTAGAADIDHGVPMFLDELVDELRLKRLANPEISKTASRHGHDLLRQGLTVSQVVHGYGDVCQAITEMAVQKNAPISADDFRMLNRSLDDAIASAVTQYGHDRDDFIEAEAAGETERLGALAHQLRHSIRTARVALDAISSGSVGIAGSTGAVLNRSLTEANDFIDRLMAAKLFAPRGRTKAKLTRQHLTAKT